MTKLPRLTARQIVCVRTLVKDRGSLSEDGFFKLPATDRLRLLLAALSVPLACRRAYPTFNRLQKS